MVDDKVSISNGSLLNTFFPRSLIGERRAVLVGTDFGLPTDQRRVRCLLPPSVSCLGGDSGRDPAFRPIDARIAANEVRNHVGMQRRQLGAGPVVVSANVNFARKRDVGDVVDEPVRTV